MVRLNHDAEKIVEGDEMPTSPPLTPRMQQVSSAFADLIAQLCEDLPVNVESAAVFKKLLEAKDYALLALLKQ